MTTPRRGPTTTANGPGRATARRLATLPCLLLILAGLVHPAPLGLASTAAGTNPSCDPRVPPTCTLRDLATPVGLLVGATAEPDQVAPGPYAATLAREFNAVTPENALKWYTVQPAPGDWQFAAADAVVSFARAHALEVRGHTLVWAQDRYTPAWVQAFEDPDALRALVDEQIRTVMTRYRDHIHRWDVVNEPLAALGTGPSDSVFWRVLGSDWVAEAFRTAHAVDPTAELWLNEYGTDWVPQKHGALVDLVTDLLASGTPVHGIGLQVHRLGVGGPDQATFEAQLRDFTALGLDVAVTELDVPTNPTDPNAFADQANAYERIVAACLAVDRCREITTWGVTDRSTWLDSLGIFPTPTRPLLFDDEFRAKPAYDAVRRLLADRALAQMVSTTTLAERRAFDVTRADDRTTADAIAELFDTHRGDCDDSAIHRLIDEVGPGIGASALHGEWSANMCR